MSWSDFCWRVHQTTADLVAWEYILCYYVQISLLHWTEEKLKKKKKSSTTGGKQYSRINIWHREFLFLSLFSSQSEQLADICQILYSPFFPVLSFFFFPLKETKKDWISTASKVGICKCVEALDSWFH